MKKEKILKNLIELDGIGETQIEAIRNSLRMKKIKNNFKFSKRIRCKKLFIKDERWKALW